MSCECYQVGGRFIAEDPDCPAHGTAAQREQDSLSDSYDRLERAGDALSEALSWGRDAGPYTDSIREAVAAIDEILSKR